MRSNQYTTIRLSLNGGSSSKTNVYSSSTLKKVYIGSFTSKIGYNKITLSIAHHSGKPLSGRGLVQKFDLKGTFQRLKYVDVNTDDGFYWGRRGPSGHLWMNGITGQNVSYFYS